ncbi:MAG: hypothetical protein HC773_29740, partial [Scytonema sp. CRU_2_7]|nr:hypothetical protein [Scytonema sp. CRU_2_7]
HACSGVGVSPDGATWRGAEEENRELSALGARSANTNDLGLLYDLG